MLYKGNQRAQDNKIMHNVLLNIFGINNVINTKNIINKAIIDSGLIIKDS
jgi:hypothetical protein